MGEVVLRLPQAVWARCGLPAEVPCHGATAREALDDACRRVPELSTYLAPAEPGSAQLSRSVLLFADGVRVRDLDSDPVSETAVLRLVIPSAGG